VANGGIESKQAASFSIGGNTGRRQAATGSDPDAGNGVGPAQYVIGNDRHGCQRAVELARTAGLGAAPGDTLGTSANGGCVTTSSTTSEPLALHSSRRPSRPVRRSMKSGQDDRLRRQSRRSIPPRWSSGRRSGAGAGTCSAAMTSSMAARTVWGLPSTAPITAAQTTCVAAERARSGCHGERTTSARRVHFSTIRRGARFSYDVSNAMQLRGTDRRARCGDPAYVDETWINDRVQLVRRLRNWGEHVLPGTATGITNTTGAR